MLLLLLLVLVASTRRSVLESFRSLGQTRGEFIGGQVEAYLYQAERIIEDIERQIRHGVCAPEDSLSLESTLFAEVLNNPQVAELTLTHRRGWQLSVFPESGEAESPILVRATRKEGRGHVSAIRRRLPPGGSLRREPAADPTEHLTFRTPASPAFYGQILWSDLSYSQLDAHLPENAQRVVVTVMKAIEDRGGRFVGVVRVGLLTRQLDQLVQRASGADERVFLCDAQGRLVTRLGPDDRLQDLDDDLRFLPATVPPEIAAALRHPVLAQISPRQLVGTGEFAAEGREFLVSYRGLAHTQGWRVGIVVAEDSIEGLQALLRTRNRLLGISLFVIIAILGGGVIVLRSLRRGLGQIVDETARMHRFDFSPSGVETPFRDVREAMESLETAKTAMRAMSKYVPVDLVRQLYETNRDPVLGGQLLDLSLMFTDVRDFTTHAERLSPDVLARIFGRYLGAMTGAIQGAGGTVDKYIGDAVMAMWNAPRSRPDHATRACQAALACLTATEQLYAFPDWQGLPRFVTRFGLHRGEVMVGHFGAPDRMSYTALGDGVNLASRVEGLNKQYGTTILATQAIEETAREGFAFRRLDRVAVKGKSKGTLIYELLGPAGLSPERLAAARAYEAALDLYFAGDFAAALGRFEALAEDPPSRVLADRCRGLLAHGGARDWDGIFVASTK